ncbi:hypothetical protein [Gluconacetobacter asukensis]|uniref:Uncharacterized protein n=1 Tax=Gluconacetobacter asukensis TaxID=1017181 RepID=A0A7W4J2Y2_9PROT|nr:hypothetical protein [Gluconacetobacter asukensis]MBB2173483.1 hypothetical protein [Gluconacetobacter asukensis]
MAAINDPATAIVNIDFFRRMFAISPSFRMTHSWSRSMPHDRAFVDKMLIYNGLCLSPSGQGREDHFLVTGVKFNLMTNLRQIRVGFDEISILNGTIRVKNSKFFIKINVFK